MYSDNEENYAVVHIAISVVSNIQCMMLWLQNLACAHFFCLAFPCGRLIKGDTSP